MIPFNRHAGRRLFASFTSRRLVCGLFGIIACCLPPAGLLAQGSVSMLGFGYPVGGLSTRASGTVGSFAEFDALTATNPASIWGVQRSVLTMQAEPEYRTLTLNGIQEHSRTQRNPLMMAGMRMTPRLVLSVSAATFLDRTYATTGKGTAIVEGDTLVTTDRLESKGAIADLRFAAGYMLNKRIRVGIGAHLFTGNNQVEQSRRFSDTTKFGSVIDTSIITFLGKGVSFGGEALLVKGLTASASIRIGGKIEASKKDSILSHANIPNRMGVGIRYDGIPGSIFAFNVEKVNWSAMRGLGSSAVTVQDATNWSLGAELAGPRFMGNPVLVRAGFAKNSLPFGIGSSFASEHRFGGGVGIPMPHNFASIDLSLQRANRQLAGNGVRESAWLFGAGMQVRP